LKFLIKPQVSKDVFNYYPVFKHQINHAKVLTHSNIYYTVFESYYYIHEENFTLFKKNTKTAQINFLNIVTKKKKMNYPDNQLDSYKRVNNLPVIIRFLNYLFRHGLKTKTLKDFNKGLSDFYFYFYFFNKKINAAYKHYNDVYALAPTLGNFYRFDSILKSIADDLEPFFYLKVERVEKKFRKKLKKKFTSKIIYINPKKRSNLSYKALAYYPKLFSQYDLSSRIGEGLFKTFIEQKDSYLYKRKIFMYSKVLKKFQKGVF